MANTTDNFASQIGKILKDQWTQAVSSFSSAFSMGSAISAIASKAKEAIAQLKEVNTYLTRLSSLNNSLSKSQLKQIGSDAFDVAGRYGKSATDYLAALQEISRQGYKNAESIAELSVAVQNAGDLTSELADRYIIAADKAYKMNGSVEALTATLDGANNITNHNAVSMTELAEGMSAVGTQAASSQMKIDETTAALATLIAVTNESGTEMGNAFKGILMNLQQITGVVGDGGDIIDEDSLSEYEKACNDLGVSLSQVKDGAVSLKEPMQLLKELSEEYTKLDASDSRRSNLLSSLGGDERAIALNAILENYDLYEKMLQDYADGTGSIAKEAEKTADSWEGSLNRLSNTWTDTLGNIANSDAIVSIVNGLNGLLSVINTVTDKLNIIPIAISAIYTAISTNHGGGLIRLINLTDSYPFLATVEFNSDVYDFYAFA